MTRMDAMNSPHVLVVDDNRDFAESLADLLVLRGCEVQIAHSGEVAIRLSEEMDFDVTLMDVMLPGMNGVDSYLKIHSLKPKARVVMMTGHSVPGMLDRAISNGVSGVLQKPLDLEALMDLIPSRTGEGIVLLIDDDADFLSMTEIFLSQRGFSVVTASDGETAVKLVLENSIDVMILDLKLPIMSGLDVYAQLRAQNRTLPTIILTGYADEESASIEKLRSMSVTDIFSKPFDSDELCRTIHRLIEVK